MRDCHLNGPKRDDHVDPCASGEDHGDHGDHVDHGDHGDHGDPMVIRCLSRVDLQDPV